VDVPVGGCSSDLGCFRVLTYRDDPDGKRVATGSDGWILAVEFGDQPARYSVLAYGESPRPDSPFFSDQAAMFARGSSNASHGARRNIDAQDDLAGTIPAKRADLARARVPTEP
jgi:acyl-homoserine-lactone acylase